MLDNIDWDEYERRVQAYEQEGLTRSDAQGVVDAEMMNEGYYLTDRG